MKRMFRKFAKVFFMTLLKLRTRKFSGRMEYLWIRKGYKHLIIVFSAFGDKPVFNYLKSLNGVRADRLYILDDFAHKGSYYWFENGMPRPLELTNGLIAYIRNRWGISKLRHSVAARAARRRCILV